MVNNVKTSQHEWHVTIVISAWWHIGCAGYAKLNFIMKKCQSEQYERILCYMLFYQLVARQQATSLDPTHISYLLKKNLKIMVRMDEKSRLSFQKCLDMAHPCQDHFYQQALMCLAPLNHSHNVLTYAHSLAKMLRTQENSNSTNNNYCPVLLSKKNEYYKSQALLLELVNEVLQLTVELEQELCLCLLY